jgi:hypothetical protein
MKTSTRPMRSVLYRKHYRSKKDFPTKIIAGSTGHKGGIQLGHEKARRDVEQKLGRKLYDPPNSRPRTSGGNWVFYELRNPTPEAMELTA